MTPKNLAWVAFAAFSIQMGVAQDFKRSYAISQDGKIFINTSGNITVQGYKGFWPIKRDRMQIRSKS
jgi:hypothetical protein